MIEEIEIVKEVMACLKNMACGGIGDHGPTWKELDFFCDENGRPMDDDADYHSGQWCYSKLGGLLKMLEAREALK